MFASIPPEILIPAISAMGLAALAHLVTILMQARSNKHDFSLKTFESVTIELASKNEQLSTERKDNRDLSNTNVDLRGEKYLLEASLQVMTAQRDDALGEVASLNEKIRKLEENLFQKTTALEVAKKTNERLADRLKELDS